MPGRDRPEAALSARPLAKTNRQLLAAAIAGKARVIDHLLKHGADIDHCNEDGASAIMLAALHQHHDCVSLLLSLGAKLDIVDLEGRDLRYYENPPEPVPSKMTENEMLSLIASINMTYE